MSELENSGDPAPIELKEVADELSSSHLKRRRLVKTVFAAGSVILTLKGQSALAAGCASPSRIVSGVPSQGAGAPPPCVGGRSPGYWKTCQHLGEWPKPPPTFTFQCLEGMPGKDNELATQGALFQDLFTGAGNLASFGCWRILAYPTRVDKALADFDIKQIQLARHLIATYFNRMVVGVSFPLTFPQIQSMWTKGSIGAYCPDGAVSCTSPWTVEELVCYLRNYTMDVSDDPFTLWSCV